MLNNKDEKSTHFGVDLCNNNVISVDIPGQRQLFERIAYLNSS